MRKRVPIAVAVVVAVVLGLSACALGGNTAGDRAAERANLANQRKAAIAFLGVQGGVEKIRFTQEGTYLGSGSWAVNAVVTIHGNEYKEILGEGLLGGDQLPDVPPSPAAVVVMFSDHSSETIQQ